MKKKKVENRIGTQKKIKRIKNEALTERKEEKEELELKEKI